MKPTLIIDADDTLWESEIYYQACITTFGQLMASQGFDEQVSIETLDQVERARVAMAGYGPIAFSQNLGLAYERLCQQYDLPVQENIRQAALATGEQVMAHEIVLLEGVAETLPRLGEQYRLILLTKGDQDVQTSKLTRSGLAPLFDGVHVVAEKDETVFRELMSQYDLDPHHTWMIGNSPRSDINPALAAGLQAIHIPHHTTWAHEQEPLVDSERITVLASFSELEYLFLNNQGGCA